MAEVPEVDYTAEEEAAMGGETQPEGETPSVKTPEGVEADPTEVRTSAKPLEAVKQESRDNQAVTTPGKTARKRWEPQRVRPVPAKKTLDKQV